MAKSWEKRLLLYKIEVTEGTDSVPVVGTDAIITRNLSVGDLNGEQKIREIDGQYFGARPSVYTAFTRPVSFEVELTGGGGAATVVPGWMRILRIMGFDAGVAGGSNVVQSLISSAVPTATLYPFLDNLRLATMGCRGNATFRFEDDEIPFFTADLMGAPVSGFATETTPGTPTFVNAATPQIASTANTTFALGAYAAPLRSLDINLGNAIELRSLIGPADTYAFRNREITATALIELPDLGTKNYYTNINGATIALQILHGTGTGNKVQFDAARAEVGTITLSEEQGKVMASIPMRFLPTAAGNDEMTITTS